MPTLQRSSYHSQDLGILAVALHALEDFAPWVAPAEGGLKQAVVATCPVCGINEPAARDALRVVQVGKANQPKRLSWFCYLHNGDYRGIGHALGKHRAAKSTNLRERLAWNHKVHPGIRYAKPNGGSDLALSLPGLDSATSDPDPVQKALRCEAGRWKAQYSKSQGLERSMSLRCRRCPPCKSYLRVHRISQVVDKLAGCSSCQSDKTRCAGGCHPVHTASLERRAYANATRLLRRHKVPYVGIPAPTGRVILARTSLLAGDEVKRENLTLVIGELVDAMPDESKVSVSTGNEPEPDESERTVPERIEPESTTDWVDVGSTRLSIGEQAKVYSRFGCSEVLRKGKGASSGNVVFWDVGHLKGDDLLALHVSLGLRVWRKDAGG